MHDKNNVTSNKKLLLFNYLVDGAVIRVLDEEVCFSYGLRFEYVVANMMTTGDLHSR